MFRKKLVTKTLSIALAVSMMTSVLPMNAYASNVDTAVDEIIEESVEEVIDEEDVDDSDDENDVVEDNNSEEVTEEETAEEIEEEVVEEEVTDEEIEEVVEETAEDIEEEVVEEDTSDFEYDYSDYIDAEAMSFGATEITESFDSSIKMSIQPKSGDELIYIKGDFVSSAENIDKYETYIRDELRKDAYKNAYADPAKDTGAKLYSTSYSYRDTLRMRWSTAYELIARQRAIEASLLYKAYTRPNKDTNVKGLKVEDGKFVVTSPYEIVCLVDGTAEDPISTALTTIKKQAATYKANYKDTKAANYKILINPLNASVGAAAFKLENSSKYVVVFETGSHATGKTMGSVPVTETGFRTDVEPWPSQFAVNLKPREEGYRVEIHKDYLKEYSIAGIEKAIPTGLEGKIVQGKKFTIGPDVAGKTVTYLGEVYGMGATVALSEDESVLSIDNKGNYKALKEGTVKIRYVENNVAKDMSVQVVDNDKALELVKPTKLEYIIGTDTAINLAGGSVKDLTANNPTKTSVALSVTNTKPVDTVNFNKPGVYTYVVTVGMFTAEFDITVMKPPVCEELTFGGLPIITMVPKAGNVLTYVNGTFYPIKTEEEKLKWEQETRTIRADAIANRLPNPLEPTTKVGLLSWIYDYRNTRTMKYSASYEAIARQRAIEVSLLYKDGSLVRPNGDSTLKNLKAFDGVNTIYSENEIKVILPASSKDPIKDAFASIKKQRTSYISNYLGKDAKDFSMMINPLLASFGVAAFKLEGADKIVVIFEFGSRSTGLKMGKVKYGQAGFRTDVEPWTDQRFSPLASSINAKGFPVEIAKKYFTIKINGIYSAMQPGSEGQLVGGIDYTIPECVTKSLAKHSGDIIGGKFTVPAGSEDFIYVDDDLSYVIGDEEGTFELKYAAADAVATKKIQVVSNENALKFIPPTKTVYYIGEPFDYTGGEVTDLTLADPSHTVKKLNKDNTKYTGSEEIKETGLYTFETRVGDFTRDFDVLYVKPLNIEMDYGFTLDDLYDAIGSNEFGEYSVNAADFKNTLAPGAYKFTASFIPDDSFDGLFKKHTAIPFDLTVKRSIDGSNGDVEFIFADEKFVYSGYEIAPSFSVKIGEDILKEGRDYTVTYGDDEHNNIDIGDSGIIKIQGCGYYKDSKEYEFSIEKIPLYVTAKSYSIGIETGYIPEYECTVDGLLADHKVTFTGYEASCEFDAGDEVGDYDIIPEVSNINISYKNQDVTENYDIIPIYGLLRVVPDFISYDVIFAMNGHGADFSESVPAGFTVNEPEVIDDDGFEFVGWYKEPSFKTEWIFDKDLVQSTTVLYARWVEIAENDFRIENISDQIYTGSPIKPQFAVYDGDKLLKAGTDYSVKYFNNVNVNFEEATSEFNGLLPYAKITGLHNYDGVYTVNFNIVPVDIACDSKFVVNTAGSFLKSSSATKVYSSVNWKNKISINKDYTVKLVTEKAYDNNKLYVKKGYICDDAKVPAGWYGTFNLVVEGIGNFDNIVIKTINVADSTHLMSRAAVTISTDYKNMVYTGKNIELPSVAVSVKFGKTTLVYGKDYTISYSNNNAVGTATLTVTGCGNYIGTKNATFTIKGKPFNTNTVICSNMVEGLFYTGKPLCVNNAKLKYINSNGTSGVLFPGIDYTVSYAKNVKKGTATVTFKGKASAGYTGQVSYKFKIYASDIASKLVEKDNWDAPLEALYSPSGAVINDDINLFNTTSGMKLVQGTDYTISYSGNTGLPGTVAFATIKGKGSYTGSVVRKFNIIAKDIEDDSIMITTKPVGYVASNKASFVYRPSVVIKDGKSKVGTNKVSVKFEGCNQASVRAYLEDGGEAPRAIIKAVSGSGYEGETVVELPFYNSAVKLTAANTYVVVDSVTYNAGKECIPNVRVYRCTNATTFNIIKKLKDHDSIVEIAGAECVVDPEDYTVKCKKNIFAGKNTATAVITGVTPSFGGSVSVKFDISRKNLDF